MATTREQLQQITGNLDESLGIRHSPVRSLPVPKAEARDLGRVPFRNAGRIPTDHIIPDPNQPRKEFDDESLQQLGQSLDSTGQLNPIRVRWSDDHQKWLIVCGERRWRAARLAGRHEIDCLFIEGELPAGEILQQQLIENCQREDLQPMELAHGFADLMTLNDWNAKQVADSMHVPASKVTRILALRKLPSEVQQQVADRHIPERTAYELSKLTCEKTIRQLAQQAAQGRLTTAQARKTVTRRQKHQSRKARSSRQTFLTESGWKIDATCNSPTTYQELEQALRESLDEVRHRIANGIRMY